MKITPCCVYFIITLSFLLGFSKNKNKFGEIDIIRLQFPPVKLWEVILNSVSCIGYTILRKTIEGYIHSILFLKFSTIKSKLNIRAFHSSRYLQSNLIFKFSHASVVKIQCSSKYLTIYSEKPKI